ncbi:MAG: hypothetical protein RLZZ293_54, partial [Pseudomonadota bacterium]
QAIIVAGYRTSDIATNSKNEKVVGTSEFTDQIINFIQQYKG